VAILSDAYWKRLGGDAAVLTRPLFVNGRAFTVVGVAPRGFGGSLALAAPEFWVPTGVYETMAFDVVNEGLGATLADSRHRDLALVARLHDGVTIDQLASGLELLSRQRESADP